MSNSSPSEYIKRLQAIRDDADLFTLDRIATPEYEQRFAELMDGITPLPSLLQSLLQSALPEPPPKRSTERSEGEKPDAQSAKQLLHGWRAIDEALELSRSYPNMNYDERRRKLTYLNRRFGGPIKAGGKGSQPVVNRFELIAWWNSLEEQVEDQKARIRDKQATLQSRHPYGRAAQVAPDLGGSVKRRKSSSRKSDKT
jgi:hypothetical protein